jgi:membrane-bound lytic murein transglycosylase B
LPSLPGLSRRSALVASLGAFAAPVRAAPATSDFSQWLYEFRKTALEQGISGRTLDRALAGLAPIDRVIELDRRQPEGRMTFAQYRERVVHRERIVRGGEMLREHESLLGRIRERYGVPPQIVVALWGIESNYGETMGSFSVVGSLATLAWEGRRASFFRKELLSALQILEKGDVDPEHMFGSWAGAMGQCQFMPSTFLAYAVDHDGDGRRDIWQTVPDVLASMANYLYRSGWRDGYIWGREVTVPRGLDRSHFGLDSRASLASWQRRGVRTRSGSSLPDVAIEASLVGPDEGDGPAFLVYNNFRTLMVWNRSTYFALSVGLLADAIDAAAS